MKVSASDSMELALDSPCADPPHEKEDQDSCNNNCDWLDQWINLWKQNQETALSKF